MSALKKLAAFRHAFILLRRNDPLILASATAFFTTFSLPPIIIILVSVLGLYFKSEHIRQQLFDKLTSMLGGAATGEIEKIVHNFMKLEGNAWVTAGGFLFLLFVATTLLSIIRKAIHQLWHIRRKSSMKLYYSVKERMLGLGMLLFIGLLFLASILMDASVSLFRQATARYLSGCGCHGDPHTEHCVLHPGGDHLVYRAFQSAARSPR